MPGRERPALIVERLSLETSLRSFEALVGLVGRRVWGRTAASRIISSRRSSASSRLRFWLRCACATITMTPSWVSRLPASFISRIATSLGSDGERRASKRSCTALDTLLTFCPPGPEARTKLSSISLSSIAMDGVT